MLLKFKQLLNHNLSNIPGWRTKRKIVVIESDDWGSVRIPSKIVREQLISNKIKLDFNLGYDNYDTLESPEDLQKLFEVCSSVRDKDGKPAVITANCIVANPDFEKIQESNYNTFHYELITKTMNNYFPNSFSFDVWKKGIEEKFFYPQFHGREHINVQMWLNALRMDYEGARYSFKLRYPSIQVESEFDIRQQNNSAYNYLIKEELNFIRNSIEDGLNIFESLFGFRSKSAICPAFVWDDEIENILYRNGVKYIQGSPFQKFPQYTEALLEKKGKYHFCGQKNSHNQIYLVRNVFFEPSSFPDRNFYDECLSRVKIAFRWGKPAIISAHRLNFTGSIDTNNRDKNLILLKRILIEIVNKWPDVEFMSSDVLGEIIETDLF